MKLRSQTFPSAEALVEFVNDGSAREIVSIHPDSGGWTLFWRE